MTWTGVLLELELLDRSQVEQGLKFFCEQIEHLHAIGDPRWSPEAQQLWKEYANTTSKPPCLSVPLSTLESCRVCR